MTPVRTLVVASMVGLMLVAGGCAKERHEDIPPQAMMAIEGNDELTYRAPYDGAVYIYDVDGDRMVYSGQVNKGDTVRIEPDEDKVMIGTTTVAEKEGLDPGNKHRIFFDEAAPPDRVVVPAGTRVEVKDEVRTEIRAPQQPDRTIEVRPDQPDTKVNIEGDRRSDTEIKVDDDGETEVKVR